MAWQQHAAMPSVYGTGQDVVLPANRQVHVLVRSQPFCFLIYDLFTPTGHFQRAAVRYQIEISEVISELKTLGGCIALRTGLPRYSKQTRHSQGESIRQIFRENSEKVS